MTIPQDEGPETMDPVSLQTIRKVADEESIELTDLPPLQDAIETDALDALFASVEHEIIRVEFTYCGYTITVDGKNQVGVELA